MTADEYLQRPPYLIAASPALQRRSASALSARSQAKRGFSDACSEARTVRPLPRSRATLRQDRSLTSCFNQLLSICCRACDHNVPSCVPLRPSFRFSAPVWLSIVAPSLSEEVRDPNDLHLDILVQKPGGEGHYRLPAISLDEACTRKKLIREFVDMRHNSLIRFPSDGAQFHSERKRSTVKGSRNIRCVVV